MTSCPRCPRGRIFTDEDGRYCVNCGHRPTPPVLTPEEMIAQWGPNHLRGDPGKGRHQPRQGKLHIPPNGWYK